MQLVTDSGVRGKINAMEESADRFRREAEHVLLDPAATAASARPPLDLFYTREEGDEIY